MGDARGLPVSIELTVQYRLTADGAPLTIATWGPAWEDKIVNPVVRNIVRNVVGGFNAEELPTKRNEIATMIENGIRGQIEALEGRPVSVESVQLREIVLPEKIKDQIERVQIANQESERVRYEVLRAKAQAAANKEIAKSLTGELLEMQQIQVQGKFNDALRENKDAKIFLTPGGSTPNIWVDTKDKSRDTVVNQ